MITPRSALKFDLFADASQTQDRRSRRPAADHRPAHRLWRAGRAGGRPSRTGRWPQRRTACLPHRSDGARADLEAPVQPLGRADGIPVARPHELPALLPAAGLDERPRPQHHLALCPAHRSRWCCSTATRRGCAVAAPWLHGPWRAGHRRHAGASTTPAHRQARQGTPGARPGSRLERCQAQAKGPGCHPHQEARQEPLWLQAQRERRSQARLHPLHRHRHGQ